MGNAHIEPTHLKRGFPKHDMVDILNDAQDDINIPNILNITVGCMVDHSGLAGAATSRSPALT